MTGTLFHAVMAVGLLLLAWGFAQFLLWYRWGRAELDAALATIAAPRHEYHLAFLVPCLDEARVVRETVGQLQTLAPDATVIVVDDGSGDETGWLASAAGAIVVRRDLPDARQGKGPALNHGFRALVEIVEQRGLDPERTIVCVMDADGRLSSNALPEVEACFDDERVGGVQLPVRIRNKQTFLGRMQDFEFWGMSAVAQMARIRTRSVSLGGNGQFTRLSALRSVGAEPWSSELTEDLDLGLELTLRGWALGCAPAAWVSQQGVESVRALLRQRTRWYQGHMRCARKGRALWESPRVARRTALESTIYLLTPGFVMLPWSIAFTLGLGHLAASAMQGESIALDGVRVHVVFFVAFWYLLTFLPPVVLGLLYAQRSQDESTAAAVAKGHAQVFYAYLNMAAGWRALGRIVLRRDGWSKTARVTEDAKDNLQRAA
jgi:1,2-diacylglycerol 3-beta-glucosyltransferase